jgi:uncharacterized protein YbaP (TraB family)
MHQPGAKEVQINKSALIAAIAATLVLFAPDLAQAEPLLWKVTNGAATVYLFGSVHLLKPGAVWDTPKVEAALARSGELWEEVANIDDMAAARPLVQSLGLDPGHPLTAKLDPAHQVALASALKTLGAPPTAFDPMRPWLAAVTLDIAPLLKAGYDPKAGVDILIKHAADQRGLPVKGFETLAQQLHYFADMSPKDELALLDETLDQIPDATDDLNETEAAWEQGDETRLASLMRKGMSDELYQLLLVKRNQAFALAIAERLKSPGVAFVVVGAGHLAGPDSVQAKLKRLGFKAMVQ